MAELHQQFQNMHVYFERRLAQSIEEVKKSQSPVAQPAANVEDFVKTLIQAEFRNLDDQLMNKIQLITSSMLNQMLGPQIDALESRVGATIDSKLSSVVTSVDTPRAPVHAAVPPVEPSPLVVEQVADTVKKLDFSSSIVRKKKIVDK